MGPGESEKKRLYFAYGSNMDAAQMKGGRGSAGRCPGAEFAGTATLRGYRFELVEKGVATVREDPCSLVRGVLWLLGPADERDLDRCEGVRGDGHAREAGGCYFKVDVAVAAGGGEKEAFTYIANDLKPMYGCGGEKDGRLVPGGNVYLEKIVNAGAGNDFPPEYISELNSWFDTPGEEE